MDVFRKGTYLVPLELFLVIPITILIMFTIDYVMSIILPNITTNNCNLNLFVCFSMVYTRVKLSLIVMYSLTRLSTVKCL